MIVPPYDSTITFRIGRALCMGKVRGVFKHLEDDEIYLIVITETTHLVYHVKLSSLEENDDSAFFKSETSHAQRTQNGAE